MRKQPVMVRYRRLSLDDVEAIDEFERSLAKVLKGCAQSEGVTAEIASEKLRRTILGRIAGKAASLITAEAVARIHGATGVGEKRKLALGIPDELSKFVYRELVVMSGLPGRGRRREYADRDRGIFQMHRSGSSYGKIATKLNISRHAVQAASRRQRARRISFRKFYPQLKRILGEIGILLEEEKVAK